MHAFEQRISELLDSIPNMTIGHRERLIRPLRQDDAVCWGPMPGEHLDAVMKAGMRVVAHELLDQFCFHMEAALTRCHSDNGRLLMMALVAQKMPESASILFRDGHQTSGISYPGAETLVFETDVVFPPGVSLSASLSASDGRDRVDLLVESIRLVPPDDKQGPSSTAVGSLSTALSTTKRHVAIVIARPKDDRPQQSVADKVPILHFSESEIAENPFRCARSVHDLLLSGCVGS